MAEDGDAGAASQPHFIAITVKFDGNERKETVSRSMKLSELKGVCELEGTWEFKLGGKSLSSGKTVEENGISAGALVTAIKRERSAASLQSWRLSNKKIKAVRKLHGDLHKDTQNVVVDTAKKTQAMVGNLQDILLRKRRGKFDEGPWYIADPKGDHYKNDSGHFLLVEDRSTSALYSKVIERKASDDGPLVCTLQTGALRIVSDPALLLPDPVDLNRRVHIIAGKSQGKQGR